MNTTAKHLVRCFAASIAIASANAAFAEARQFEVEVRFVETTRKALADCGDFAANGTDAAALLEKLSSSDSVVLETHRMFVRPDEKRLAKIITEYRYPSEYSVQVGRRAATTNEAAGVFATVEPQSFTMRGVGTVWQVSPSLTDDADLVDLEFIAERVAEPTWMNYGVRANWTDADAFDLPMEQPFFPCMMFDTTVKARLGRTFVLGGMSDGRNLDKEGSVDKVVLAFVTVERAGRADGGKAENPMAAPSGCCASRSNVELDIRYVLADRKTLSDIGYFGTNRIEAAALLERLTEAKAKLVAWPGISVRPGAEAVVKDVVEYIYPTQYDIMTAVDVQQMGESCSSCVGAVGAVVEPQGFTMREVGAIVAAKPTLVDDGKLIDLDLDMQFVGEPTWKDYGVKAKRWMDAKTYDLPMRQPFFQCLAHIEDSVFAKPGETYVFGSAVGGAYNDGKSVLVFVTPRLVEP